MLKEISADYFICEEPKGSQKVLPDEEHDHLRNRHSSFFSAEELEINVTAPDGQTEVTDWNLDTKVKIFPSKLALDCNLVRKLYRHCD